MRVRYTFPHQPRLGDDIIIENAVTVPRIGEAVAIYGKDNLRVDHVRWEVTPEVLMSKARDGVVGMQNVTVFLGYR
jgi:hypothetical protein